MVSHIIMYVTHKYRTTICELFYAEYTPSTSLLASSRAATTPIMQSNLYTHGLKSNVLPQYNNLLILLSITSLLGR